MSMTAAELFEVVKDVPREAWGELDWYCGEFVRKHTYDVVESDVAEHAFIGSMTAWLAAKQKYPTHAIYKDNALFEDHAMVSVNNRQIAYRQPSLVAALAAACKEAA